MASKTLKPASLARKVAQPKAKGKAASKTPKSIVRATIAKVLAAPAPEGGPILTPKQEAFALGYMTHGVASRAYRDAYDAQGSSAQTVHTEAWELLINPKVARRIREIKDKIAERLLMSKGDTLAEVTKLATFDVRRLFNADGSPIPFQDLDADTAVCIAGVEVVEEFVGTGEDRKFVGYVKKYKVADKKGALDMMMKHHGLYGDDNAQKLNPILEMLKGMAGKSALPVVKGASE